MGEHQDYGIDTVRLFLKILAAGAIGLLAANQLWFHRSDTFWFALCYVGACLFILPGKSFR